MKSLTTVRKKSPNYPVEFKIKMVELSHRPDIRVFAFASEDKEYHRYSMIFWMVQWLGVLILRKPERL